MKRFLDVVCSAIGLLIGSPIMLLAAVAVRSTGRPVIFRQERVGRDGETFQILKFRTMSPARTGPLVTAAHDARITGPGRFLRTTKLDELPQLINVMRGEMSLVGPRPEVPKYSAMWNPDARKLILSVRPGITDPASLLFRRESEQLAEAEDPERLYVQQILPLKVEMYQRYVEQQSLLGDIGLMLKTESESWHDES
jgi:lipopolysaccharide/colanic/teichoic acid biosynthesis glycosyltransferase